MSPDQVAELAAALGVTGEPVRDRRPADAGRGGWAPRTARRLRCGCTRTPSCRGTTTAPGPTRPCRVADVRWPDRPARPAVDVAAAEPAIAPDVPVSSEALVDPAVSDDRCARRLPHRRECSPPTRRRAHPRADGRGRARPRSVHVRALRRRVVRQCRRRRAARRRVQRPPLRCRVRRREACCSTPADSSPFRHVSARTRWSISTPRSPGSTILRGTVRRRDDRPRHGRRP